MTKGISKKIKDEEEFGKGDCNTKDFKDEGPRRRKKGKQGDS